MALLISALLFLAALVLIAGHLLEQRRRQRLVTQRLQGQLTREDRLGSLMRQLGSSPIAQRSVSLDNETQILLNRVGWRKSSQRSMFAAFQVGTPVVLLGITLLVQELFFPEVDSPWIAPVVAVGIGYLLPKRRQVPATAHRPRGLDVYPVAAHSVRVRHGGRTIAASPEHGSATPVAGPDL